MSGTTDSSIVDLGAYRRLRVLRRYAAALSARLSDIPCDVHGATARVVIDVDDDGVRTISYAEPPCCASHAVLLYFARRAFDRELLATPGKSDSSPGDA
jgi:hypothetical protein